MKLSIFLVAALAVSASALAVPHQRYVDWPSDVVTTLPYHPRHNRHHRWGGPDVVIKEDLADEVVVVERPTSHIEYLDQLEIPSPDVVVVEEDVVSPYHGTHQILNVLRRTGHAVKHVGEVLANDGSFGRGYNLGLEHGQSTNNAMASATTTVNVAYPEMPVPVTVQEVIVEEEVPEVQVVHRPIVEKVIVEEAVPEPVFVQHRRHHHHAPTVVISEPEPEFMYTHHPQSVVEIIEDEEYSPIVHRRHHHHSPRVVISEPEPEFMYTHQPQSVVEIIEEEEYSPIVHRRHHHHAPRQVVEKVIHRQHPVIVEEEEDIETVVVRQPHHHHRQVVVDEPETIVKHISRPVPRPVQVVKEVQPVYRTVAAEPISISEPYYNYRW